MTTGLFLLRCLQIGLRVMDLKEISPGAVLDIFVEKGNDGEEYEKIAGQADFDAF